MYLQCRHHLQTYFPLIRNEIGLLKIKSRYKVKTEGVGSVGN